MIGLYKNEGSTDVLLDSTPEALTDKSWSIGAATSTSHSSKTIGGPTGIAVTKVELYVQTTSTRKQHTITSIVFTGLQTGNS